MTLEIRATIAGDAPSANRHGGWIDRGGKFYANAYYAAHECQAQAITGCGGYDIEEAGWIHFCGEGTVAMGYGHKPNQSQLDCLMDLFMAAEQAPDDGSWTYGPRRVANAILDEIRHFSAS